MLITLLDPTDGKSYTIDVLINDARRAEKDVCFAQELLDRCKQNQNQSDEVVVEEALSEENHNLDMIEAAAVDSKQLEEQELLLQRNIWSYNQTLCLIASVENQYHDLLHVIPQIKKRAWENVSNDLLSATYIATPGECKKKWNNLVQSYKKGKVEEAPHVFTFMNRLIIF